VVVVVIMMMMMMMMMHLHEVKNQLRGADSWEACSFSASQEIPSL
jgi:hypothetical protein